MYGDKKPRVAKELVIEVKNVDIISYIEKSNLGLLKLINDSE